MLNKLSVSSSPHIHAPISTRHIMLSVIFALLPAAVYGVILFGTSAAIVIAVSVISSVLAEHIWNLILKKPNSLGDCSAVLTGLLIGMNMPARVPLYMPVIGSAVAIIVVKQMFGGLGHNFVNPAIAARIVLLVSFPVEMTRYYEPLGDIVSSATPLAGGSTGIKTLFFGMHGGVIGETSFILLCLGGAFLMLLKIISPIIPLSFMGTVALFSWALGVNPLVALMSGGLALGAIFMATDYVTSPTYPIGKLIFGVGCGVITVVIRVFGALPEGISYGILFMNLLTPHIDNLTRPKPFGSEGAKK